MTDTTIGKIPSTRLIKPRFHQSYRRVLRRTQTVKSVRRMLAILISLSLCGFIAMIVLSPSGSELGRDDAVSSDIERMVNPRFTGSDKSGTPFIITANTATRNQDDVVRTFLEKPFVQYYTRTDVLQKIISESGVYDRKARTIEMTGSVRFETEDGYTFTSDAAKLFMDDNRVRGEVPISGSGPLGSIRAGGFEMLDNGTRVRFINGVEARVMQPYRNPPSGENEAEGAGQRQ